MFMVVPDGFRVDLAKTIKDFSKVIEEHCEAVHEAGGAYNL